MEITECISTRRSVRAYTPRQINQTILDEIINCGRLAPSARNLQPWEFIIIKDKQILNKISEQAIYGQFIKDAQVCVLVLGDSKNNFTYMDCAAATQNILIAAWSFGIGSCWVQGYENEHSESGILHDYNKKLYDFLKIPLHMKVISMIPLGYPKTKSEPQGKKDLKSLMHFEKY